MPDPSWLDSRLADTAPALVGVVCILGVILWFLGRVMARVGESTQRQAEATVKLSVVLDDLARDTRQGRAEDHAWHVEKIKALAELGHQVKSHGEKLGEVHAAVHQIKDRLGNDAGG